ncbi:tyrosine-type recombinase/integrase [Terrihalobacillus insolitus]|uniref:tyrosine-type recombinase/integrase n=1 Tax=Terrihalobacillus insolitus TaxID=2950438 RepID=UPI002342326C|nr:tyrosine-type recombinase/integrase [Terrihalobacillus insolitus]MDC3413976.1 tyrosine-type recombinase/integrase [Terrihalobacillus insolitus]
MNKDRALDFFVEKLRDQDKSEATIKNYVADLRKFFAYMEEKEGAHGGTGVSATPKKAIREYKTYLEKSGLAASTVNRRLQSLRSYFNSLVEAGVTKTNPATEIKSKSIAKQNETKWLERHQVKAIFDAIDKRKQGEAKRALQRAIFLVLVNSALRVSELCELRLGDLDWNNGFITVQSGKGGKFRKVPFNSATQKAVKIWLKYRRLEGDYVFQTERSDKMTPRAVQHMTKVLSADLPFHFTVHQLRHTALKNLADKTGRIEIVATVAGHENVNTSKRYIEPSLKEIAEAMKDSEFDF